jgi:hypothetical protein
MPWRYKVLGKAVNKARQRRRDLMKRVPARSRNGI